MHVREENRRGHATAAACNQRLSTRHLGPEHRFAWLLTIAFVVLPTIGHAAGYTVIGWNNLGMHCMDADYSVFALLPPYNTVNAQLVDPQGRLVRDPGAITVTYQAIADPEGSINTSSIGKTNFWQFVEPLFGIAPAPDVGLAGSAMPGSTNQPQAMLLDAAAGWFVADGIPITPRDDAGNRQSYPLMRLIARDANGTALASTDVVLPVSDEMDCRSCHASGSSPRAQPVAGWVNDPDPQRDMRLNILRLHDDREGGTPAFQQALTMAGYNASGLFATATADATPILCARCHASNALPGTGLPGIEPLTQAIHRRMASTVDPATGTLLNDSTNRSACYRCHPGAVTRCLRGVMGNAVAADGTRAIQCQSCHGSMLDVAATTRDGWLDEPVCQSCHTGTAVNNNGQIRYLSAFDTNNQPRVAVDQTFATDRDTPDAGHSLYRFSSGHGGLKCEACHGPTHAEFPSSHANDNIQSSAHQGHVGVLAECSACHPSTPNTINGGPHGMHPIGQDWVQRHPDALEGSHDSEGGDAAASSGTAQCQACHGIDYRGTELSRAQADRTLRTEFGTKQFWRGFQIGCYTCHRGPQNDNANPNRAPQASDAAAVTTGDTPVTITLDASDPDENPLTLRIVSQPSHGTVALTGAQSIYYPDSGFSGDDSYTFAAWDGSTNSNLATVSVSVSEVAAAAAPTVTATPTAIATAAAASASDCLGDCDGNGIVSVDELVLGANIALGLQQPASCPAFDCNHNGQVTVDCLVKAVNAALSGCTATAATAAVAVTATPTSIPPTPTPTATSSGNSGATLAAIQTTIFARSCIDAGCHSGAFPAGGLSLEAGKAHDQLVGVQPSNFAALQAGLVRVKPGDPDGSFLVAKVSGPTAAEGSVMPLGKPPLTAAQIQLIRDWITAGALP